MEKTNTSEIWKILVNLMARWPFISIKGQFLTPHRKRIHHQRSNPHILWPWHNVGSFPSACHQSSKAIGHTDILIFTTKMLSCCQEMSLKKVDDEFNESKSLCNFQFQNFQLAATRLDAGLFHCIALTIA